MDQILRQDRSSKFRSNIESGQTKSSWDKSNQIMTGQVKFKLVKTDRSSQKILWAQNLFGPKMHLRMEFDSGVGQTCFAYHPYELNKMGFN